MEEKELKLLFHKITLEDLEWVTEIETKANIMLSDQTFANYWLWINMEQTEVARISDCFICKMKIEGETWFTYPVSDCSTNRIQCIHKIEELCQQEKLSLRFIVLTEDNYRELNTSFRHLFEIEPVRDRFDYVYKCDKLANLKGKKLASKRNHIHRFEDGGAWSYERLDASNLEECWQLELNWFEAQDNINQLVLEEKAAIRKAVDYFERLKLSGGLIRQKGKVVAFCIGERLNSDTFVVHFEKAYADIQGAYQILNQQFAINNSEYTYINREYDAGDVGLRKAKMSYYPDILMKNYKAKKSGFYYATYEDQEDIIQLWNACFGDDRAYIADYFEDMFEKNNMLCICRNGKVVSMASFLSGQLRDGFFKREVVYVYALATLPVYRGRGYARKLLQHASEKYEDPLILYPVESLPEEVYGKLGFQRLFQEVKQVIDITPSGTTYEFMVHEEVSDELVEAYMDSRKSRLREVRHVAWDEKHIQYALWDVLDDEGYIFEFACGFILGMIQSDGMLLVESTVEDDYFMDCLYSLGKVYGFDKCRINNFGGMIMPGKSLEEGWYKDGIGYLGLSLG